MFSNRSSKSKNDSNWMTMMEDGRRRGGSDSGRPSRGSDTTAAHNNFLVDGLLMRPATHHVHNEGDTTVVPSVDEHNKNTRNTGLMRSGGLQSTTTNSNNSTTNYNATRKTFPSFSHQNSSQATYTSAGRDDDNGKRSGGSSTDNGHTDDVALPTRRSVSSVGGSSGGVGELLTAAVQEDKLVVAENDTRRYHHLYQHEKRKNEKLRSAHEHLLQKVEANETSYTEWSAQFQQERQDIEEYFQTMIENLQQELTSERTKNKAPNDVPPIENKEAVVRPHEDKNVQTDEGEETLDVPAPYEKIAAELKRRFTEQLEHQRELLIQDKDAAIDLAETKMKMEIETLEMRLATEKERTIHERRKQEEFRKQYQASNEMKSRRIDELQEQVLEWELKKEDDNLEKDKQAATTTAELEEARKELSRLQRAHATELAHKDLDGTAALEREREQHLASLDEEKAVSRMLREEVAAVQADRHRLMDESTSAQSLLNEQLLATQLELTKALDTLQETKEAHKVLVERERDRERQHKGHDERWNTFVHETAKEKAKLQDEVDELRRDSNRLKDDHSKEIAHLHEQLRQLKHDHTVEVDKLSKSLTESHKQREEGRAAQISMLQEIKKEHEKREETLLTHKKMLSDAKREIDHLQTENFRLKTNFQKQQQQQQQQQQHKALMDDGPPVIIQCEGEGVRSKDNDLSPRRGSPPKAMDQGTTPNTSLNGSHMTSSQKKQHRQHRHQIQDESSCSNTSSSSSPPSATNGGPQHPVSMMKANQLIWQLQEEVHQLKAKKRNDEVEDENDEEIYFTHAHRHTLRSHGRPPLPPATTTTTPQSHNSNNSNLSPYSASSTATTVHSYSPLNEHDTSEARTMLAHLGVSGAGTQRGGRAGMGGYGEDRAQSSYYLSSPPPPPPPLRTT